MIAKRRRLKIKNTDYTLITITKLLIHFNEFSISSEVALFEENVQLHTYSDPLTFCTFCIYQNYLK